MLRRLLLSVLLAAPTASAVGAAQEASYLFYVASESEDEVSLMRFTPGRGLVQDKVIPVGVWPAEIEGPHGVFVDPSGDYWYLTLGHGFPFGSLTRYATGADTVVATTTLGMFPSTVAMASGGGLVFAANSDFHGDKVPSSISVIEPETMIELDKIETCTMPHGSRFSPDGRYHYSACMVDNQLVEIDADRLVVTRRLDLAEHGTAGVCSPTWVTPAPDGKRAFVACNKGNVILAIDLESWSVARRIEAQGAPYNMDLTPDGRIVATLKGKAAVGVWDPVSGRQLAEVPTSRKVTHGVIVTPDGRYAFVTVEGIGGQPGTVEVIDLASYQTVATANVGKQAGGISFWRVD
ncbi:MAG: YncE family protein [Gemmatimonadetes bacterium]|nr:YncE family protein [Gemmatimonadota bacterium]